MTFQHKDLRGHLNHVPQKDRDRTLAPYSKQPENPGPCQTVDFSLASLGGHYKFTYLARSQAIFWCCRRAPPPLTGESEITEESARGPHLSGVGRRDP